MKPRSLLDNFGGRAGVDGAVANLYDRLLDDDAVAHYFDDVNLPTLRAHMVDFLVAALTGSSGIYRGRTLADAHRGRGITDEAFDHVVTHLLAVLDDAGVGRDSIDALVARVAPLRVDIVV